MRFQRLLVLNGLHSLNLSDGERGFLLHVLAFFASADGIVNEK